MGIRKNERIMFIDAFVFWSFFNSSFCFVGSVDMLLFRNYNRHSNHQFVVLKLCYNFHTHRRIDKHLLAFLLFFHAHSWGILSLILILLPFEFYFYDFKN